MSVAVTFEGVTKHFGDVQAVDSVDLEINDGEFFSMLGPSGSGKTTCLRMIAGFETPTAGRILLHGVDVSDRPPYERNVNTVFQDYALFPHMTVAGNVEYGLMVRKVPAAERRRRVAEALTMVHLEALSARKPAHLSGGQRQRVALARALVNRPAVLLLDEPLGALDLKLRQAMQVELKTLQREVGITFIYVTHDQEEALTMSDRMAVFNGGRVEQVGSPTEVYERPRNAFVAGFVGTSNVIPAALAGRLTGTATPFTVRPERIAITNHSPAAAPDRVNVEGDIRELMYLGMYTRYRVSVGDTELVVARQNESTNGGLQEGQRVHLSWSKESCHPLVGDTSAKVTAAGAGDRETEREKE